MANFAGATTQAGVAATKAGEGVKGATTQFTQMNKQLSRVHGGLERIMAAFKVVAAYGIAGTLTYGLINSIRSGTEVIFEFDQALYNLQAITNATESELDTMGKAIFNVAKDTKFSVKEVADGMVLLAQAGFDAAESVDAIGAVAKLATGTLTDLKTSSDLLTTVIRAFGLEATQSNRVADVMANAINRSKLTVDKLRIAFNYLGPVAAKAGLQIEDTAAATMILANAGIRASTIGTGLRQVLARLVAPNEKLREAFIAAGVDLSKFSGGSLKMRGIIEELVKIVPDAARAFQLFGLRGAPAVAALTEAGVEGFDKMYEAAIRAGEATRMAETQMEGLAVTAKNLRDRLGTLAVDIGEAGIAGAFKVLLEVLREVVKAITYIVEIPVVGQFIVSLGALNTIGLVLFSTFQFLGYALKSIIPIFAALTTGINVRLWMQATEKVGLFTVAMSVLRKTLTAHPLFFIAGAFGTFFVALFRYLDKRIEKWEAEERAAAKNVESLQRYRDELKELTPGTLEYLAVLKRLGEDFPELKSNIDELTRAWNDQGEALDELIKKNAMASFEQLAKQIAHYAKAVRSAGQSFLWMELPEFSVVDQLVSDKDVAELNERVGRLGEALSKLRIEWKPGEGPEFISFLRRSIFYLIGDMELAAGQLEQFTAVALEYLQKVYWTNYERQKQAEREKEAVSTLPSYWRSIYNQLTAIERVALLEQIKLMNQRISTWETTAKELGLTDKELAEGRAALHLRAINETIEGIGKEIWTEEERVRIIRKLQGDLLRTWKEQYKVRLEQIDKFQENATMQELRGVSDAQDAAKIKADIEKKYGKQRADEYMRIMALIKVLGEQDVRNTEAAEKKKLETKLKFQKQYDSLMARLQTDELSKAKATRQKNLDDLNIWYKEQLKLDLDPGEKEKKRQKYIKGRAEIDQKFLAERRKIYAQSELDQLELEEMYGKISIERQTALWVDGFKSREDIRLEELDIERDILNKRLSIAENFLSRQKEGTEEYLKGQNEVAKIAYDIEKNNTDKRILEHERYLKRLPRDSEEYIRYRQKMLRDAGEQELIVEREKWAIMKEYSDDWLMKLRAGLELAGIDFKLAARDWSTIVQNSANHMAGAMEEYFFQVMKGDLKSAHDAWKGFLDALLREIAKFLADRATAELIALGIRMLGALSGTTTPGTAGAAGSTYSSDAGLGRIALQHSGGQIGVDVFPRKQVPQWIIQAAPRLHSGLSPDEFPAILQRGETVTPRDEAAGAGNVNITIMTPDTRTMDEWVRRHRSLFAGATTQSIREGDKQLVSSIKRVSRG